MTPEIPNSTELETKGSLPPVLVEKREALDHRLLGIGRLMVAYSGGIDSAFLAHVGTSSVRR